MIRNTNRPWFEVWGNEQVQNQVLKGLLFFGLILSGVQSVGLVWLAMRRPVLIAITDAKTQALSVVPPTADLLNAEIKRAVGGYLMHHYNWEWNRVQAAFDEASRFVAPEFTKKFLEANAAQIKLATEKKVSQKFFFSDMTVDFAAKRVKVLGERILLIEGLRAASPLGIEVEYDLGKRTPTNPEGIYITGEILAAPTP